MEFTLHKEIIFFFANTRISNMDINQLLKFDISVFRNTGKTKTHTWQN